MKRKRSPSPYSGPWPVNQEKKAKIELPLLFAGKMISDALLCQIIRCLTVPEHARVTACDKRLNKLGKSERSWARNSTFDVPAMFDFWGHRILHPDPQKLWNLGCRTLSDIDLDYYSSDPAEEVEVPMFLSFYHKTLKKVTLGERFPDSIYKCTKLESVSSSCTISTVGELSRLLAACPLLTSLGCSLETDPSADLRSLPLSNLVELDMKLDMGQDTLLMPDLPKLERLTLELTGVPNSNAIIRTAPALRTLFFQAQPGRSRRRVAASDRAPICLFKQSIGMQLRWLYIAMDGMWDVSFISWGGLTDCLLVMSALEYLWAPVQPPESFRAPRLKMAYIHTRNLEWHQVRLWKEGIATRGWCQDEWPDEDEEKVQLERAKYPELTSFVLYRYNDECERCGAHPEEGPCICGCSCNCP